MERPDRELMCVQCGQPFNFSNGEQLFYTQNNLQEPKRCKNCRTARKNAPPAPRATPRSQGAGQGAAPRGNGRRGNTPWRPAAPDDPNGYRSPAFQDYNSDRFHQIDYAGLPKDDEEEDGQLAMLGPVRRDGAAPAPTAQAPQAPQAAPRAPRQGGNGLPRGLNGRRPDRAGTDPDAYRSPGFRAERGGPTSAPGNAGGLSRRERRAQRPRFETTCAECGAAAQVPFQPGPDRPAFCKPCYQVKKPLLGLGPGKTPNLATTDEDEGAEAPTESLAPPVDALPETAPDAASAE